MRRPPLATTIAATALIGAFVAAAAGAHIGKGSYFYTLDELEHCYCRTPA